MGPAGLGHETADIGLTGALSYDPASNAIIQRLNVTTISEGGPWFVAADVCGVLEISNAPHAVGRLDVEDRSTIAIADSGNLNSTRTTINESGLYALMLTSRKPEARAFKK